MTTAIRPIETNYSGARFRSRLEARWAVFFDALGIEWKYEVQGFKIPTPRYSEEEEQASEWWYLPDFYLPVEQCWVEVKGDASTIDVEMFTAAVDYGGHLPHVADSGGTTRGILFLGDIPKPPKTGGAWKWESGLVVHPILQHYKGATINGVAFGFEKIHEYDKQAKKWNKVRMLPFGECDGWIGGDAFSDPITIGQLSQEKMIAEWQWQLGYGNSYGDVMNGATLWRAAERQRAAYAAARGARFEHGERGGECAR